MNNNSCLPTPHELQALLPKYIQGIWREASKATKPCETRVTLIDLGIAASVNGREFSFIRCLGGMIGNIANGHVDRLLYDQALTRMEATIPGSIRIIVATIAEAIDETPSVSPATRDFVDKLGGKKLALAPA